MANSVVPTTPNYRSLTVKSIGSDWSFSDDSAYAALLDNAVLFVDRIWFFPGPNGVYGDVLIIKDINDTGAEFPLRTIDGSALQLSINGLLDPILDFSESTLHAGASFTIYYDLRAK